MQSVSVLCHLYYEDSLESLKPYLKNVQRYNASFFFNVCSETDYYVDLVQRVREAFPHSIITTSTNVGKDIGGKLVLLDTYFKLQCNTDYLILLHDKVSPHTSTGSAWRKRLLAILEDQNIENITSAFLNNNNIGLIATQDLIMNEYDEKTLTYHCTSNEKLKLLRKKYNITSNRHEFVGGTMYWVQSKIYSNFFAQYSPLKIRATLEKGNVLDHNIGSVTHAWERMFSWIVLNQGYSLKGI
jgi:lipopolysaccharide biosynthesis protein